MLAHTTRALQLLFQTIAEVDTLEELARVGMTAVELYEGDQATLRELMQVIEARATDLRAQLRLFPAPPVEAPPAAARSGAIRWRTRERHRQPNASARPRVRSALRLLGRRREVAACDDHLGVRGRSPHRHEVAP